MLPLGTTKGRSCCCLENKLKAGWCFLAIIKKATRTEIIADGETFTREDILEAWQAIADDWNDSIVVEKSSDGDWEIRIYPFKIYEGEVASQRRDFKTEISWRRKFVMDGHFPTSEGAFPTTDHVIQKYWMPICRSGFPESRHFCPDLYPQWSDQEKRDLACVSMTIVTSRDVDNAKHAVTTDIAFDIRNADHIHCDKGGLTGDQRVDRAFHNAMTEMAKGLRTIISDMSPNLMEAAYTMDMFSCELCDKLQEIADDKTQMHIHEVLCSER